MHRVYTYLCVLISAFGFQKSLNDDSRNIRMHVRLIRLRRIITYRETASERDQSVSETEAVAGGGASSAVPSSSEKHYHSAYSTEIVLYRYVIRTCCFFFSCCLQVKASTTKQQKKKDTPDVRLYTPITHRNQPPHARQTASTYLILTFHIWSSSYSNTN